jgi:hypothetical protein
MGKVNVKFDRIPRKSKSFQKKSDDLVMKKYEDSKDLFFKEVDNHPVTQEIAGGPEASNISNTLGGKGNLFSFIGFEKSASPVEDLMNALEKSFSIKKQEKKDRNRYIINFATLDKIKNVTKMPWESGNSWVARIEKGISGFSNYMYKKFESSRSGSGIQATNNIRGGSYKKTSYLTAIINHFISNMQK